MIALAPGNGKSMSINDLIARQGEKRLSSLGYSIQKLESELLLKRVKDGGQSGVFLAQAFLSAYTQSPFNLSLGQLIKIDYEGMRLFHQIVHLRHVSGWSDLEYRDLAVMIKCVLAGEVS